MDLQEKKIEFMYEKTNFKNIQIKVMFFEMKEKEF